MDSVYSLFGNTVFAHDFKASCPGGKWINIQDRQPEDRQRCIFWHDNKAYIGIYYATSKMGPHFDEGEILVMVPREVSYWMLEPEGPEND